MLQIEVGKDLKALRKWCRLNLKEAAPASETHHTHLSAIENGHFNLTLQKLEKIAAGYGKEVRITFVKTKGKATENQQHETNP
jgi:transcriptional regulator with XRE-family HTH domain